MSRCRDGYFSRRLDIVGLMSTKRVRLNQLFWYRDGIVLIILNYKVSLQLIKNCQTLNNLL